MKEGLAEKKLLTLENFCLQWYSRRENSERKTPKMNHLCAVLLKQEISIKWLETTVNTALMSHLVRGKRGWVIHNIYVPLLQIVLHSEPCMVLVQWCTPLAHAYLGIRYWFGLSFHLDFIIIWENLQNFLELP